MILAKNYVLITLTIFITFGLLILLKQYVVGQQKNRSIMNTLDWSYLAFVGILGLSFITFYTESIKVKLIEKTFAGGLYFDDLLYYSSDSLLLPGIKKIEKTKNVVIVNNTDEHLVFQRVAYSNDDYKYFRGNHDSEDIPPKSTFKTNKTLDFYFKDFPPCRISGDSYSMVGYRYWLAKQTTNSYFWRTHCNENEFFDYIKDRYKFDDRIKYSPIFDY